MRWLIAEDDRALAGFLAHGLCAESDQVELAHDGLEAIAAFRRGTPDLMVLDIEMPGQSGMEVLALVRAISPAVPVLMISARAETETRIACLEMGADDCMPKPFALRELRARCGALLRRQAAAKLIEAVVSESPYERMRQTLSLGCLEIHRMERRAEIAGAPLHLTNLEFALLEQLLLAEGAPLSRSVLQTRLWQKKQVETNALDVHIAALRRKLGLWRGAPTIKTVRGAGFFMAASPANTVGLPQIDPSQIDPSQIASSPLPLSAGAARCME